MTTVNVRYMVDDVEAAIDFYTRHLGFTLISSAAPAFADVARGDLRLLLSGPGSSAGRPMPDGRRPGPGGWNRIHLIVDDIGAEMERLRSAGLTFRNYIVTGPGAGGDGGHFRQAPTEDEATAAGQPAALRWPSRESDRRRLTGMAAEDRPRGRAVGP